MKICSDLGVKVGSGLLLQDIQSRVDLEHNEDISFGLKNLIDESFLEIKDNDVKFIFLTQKGGDYIEGVKNQSRKMKSRISELKENHSRENKGKEIMSITDEHIKKLTVPQLLRLLSKLSIGAWFMICAILGTVLGTISTVSYKIGYNVGTDEASKQVSLGQLTGEQLSLVKEIWKYQKTNDFNKVIIAKSGFIFDDEKNEATNINLAERVLGDRGDQFRFEILITSIPEQFLRLIPETRFGSPYVVNIPNKVHKILNKEIN